MNAEEVSGQTVPVAWQLGEQPAVAAAILELFHLLPAQSAKFMETEGAWDSKPLSSFHGLACSGSVLLGLTACCENSTQTVVASTWKRPSAGRRPKDGILQYLKHEQHGRLQPLPC